MPWGEKYVVVPQLRYRAIFTNHFLDPHFR